MGVMRSIEKGGVELGTKLGCGVDWRCGRV